MKWLKLLWWRLQFEKSPSMIHYNTIERSSKVTKYIDGRWVPCRHLGPYGIKNRLYCAWEVFMGRADALRWPGDQ